MNFVLSPTDQVKFMTRPLDGITVVTPDQRTSDPAIWAVGDAIQVIDAVTGVPGVVPLAGPANRQGRIAARNTDHPSAGDGGCDPSSILGGGGHVLSGVDRFTVFAET